MIEYQDKIKNEDALVELMSRPEKEIIEWGKRLDGDIIFLGIAGKIGPSLAHMARRACDEAGVKKRIIGVSRFSNGEEKKHIEELGIETIQGDLLDTAFLKSLPKVKNVFFLAGMKFGAEDNLSLTWGMNTFLPGLVAEHFKDSRIVAYSTGCIYPLVPVESGGSVETDRPEPAGEYAQSCLGRERMFEYGSKKYGTPVTIIRLNYAVEPRYGVLVDIATKVKNKQPVDLSMGYFNIIWQGDANAMVLRSTEHAESPALALNITGEETLAVRDVAEEFGKLFDVEPVFTGEESQTALLNNPGKATALFGATKISVKKLINWTAAWMKEDKKLLGKPTHFEVRDGKY
uniref:NAD-dependent epimerase/dehydratase family protein n=1 Tax=uncultured Draconibacterium sp. TaxID=1573823 RepID=UPI0032164A28